MIQDIDVDSLGPLQLGDMGVDVQIGFYSAIDDQYVELDPRIGSVEVRASLFNQTSDSASR